MKLSKILRLFVLLMVFTVGQNAWAQGFSIGAGLGLPSLLEVRVGYETNDFGVRSYLNLIGLWGADIYARVSVLNPNVTYRIGVGVVFNKDVEVTNCDPCTFHRCGQIRQPQTSYFYSMLLPKQLDNCFRLFQ
jgi:hypothetical protein